jgi:hypothetical protein
MYQFEEAANGLSTGLPPLLEDELLELELELDEELELLLELEELLELEDELELLLEDEELLLELELLLDEELEVGGGSITVQLGWLKLPSCVP